MRSYKEETLNIRINPLLKHKFSIATGFAGISATLTCFIDDYVKKYEKQYGIIPMTLNSQEKYDIITKFFGIKINKKIKKQYDLKESCKLINDLMGTSVTEAEMEFFLDNYPKTRKAAGWSFDDDNKIIRL